MNAGIKVPVAGAGTVREQAPQHKDDQVPRLPLKEKHDDYKELLSNVNANIRYYIKDGDLKALRITFNWVGIPRSFEVKEVKAKDLILEVYLDEKLVATFPEPLEEPWFFDSNYLTRQILKDRKGTFVDILRYFSWTFESLVEDLEVMA